MPRLDFEQIAAWIHASYLNAIPRASYEPFDRLPEFLKADNRDAAMRIATVLAMAGLRLEHREGREWPAADQSAIQLLIEANITVLAEAEHDGWVESRLRNGWQPGPTVNIDRREHHLLVSYHRLPEAEKDKDRRSVRNYVEIIARTDYRIVRET